MILVDNVTLQRTSCACLRAYICVPIIVRFDIARQCCFVLFVVSVLQRNNNAGIGLSSTVVVVQRGSVTKNNPRYVI